MRVFHDARGHKFLELAVNGQATVLVAGDSDLLSLNPFGAIPVITPASRIAR